MLRGSEKSGFPLSRNIRQVRHALPASRIASDTHSAGPRANSRKSIFIERLTGIAWPPLPAALVYFAVAATFVSLLIWLPFGKLAHAFLVFISRGMTGAAFARRGART